MKRIEMKKRVRDQRGFWSAFAFIFLITLGLLGLGAYALMRTESSNAANQMQMLQAEYSLNAGAHFGLNALFKGTFNDTTESTTLNIGGATVNLDTAFKDLLGHTLVMTVTSKIGSAERQVQVEFDLGMRMRDKAIITTDVDNGVSARDSLNRNDPNRLVQKADSIPTIREDSLLARATRQGHLISGDSDGSTMSNSFFQADGKTPNIYWITGDLTLEGDNQNLKQAAGIIVVLGNVTLNGSARIKGIVYLPNQMSTLIHGGGNPKENSIEGALISHGAITGTGNHANVMHRPMYMNPFCDEFQKYGDNVEDRLNRWIYT